MRITDENFESVINDNPSVMIKVGASWCGPCRAMEPIIKELDSDYEGMMIIGEADVEECEQLASRFKIRGVPTTIFFKNGKLMDKLVGGASKDMLVKKIQQIL